MPTYPFQVTIITTSITFFKNDNNKKVLNLTTRFQIQIQIQSSTRTILYDNCLSRLSKYRSSGEEKVFVETSLGYHLAHLARAQYLNIGHLAHLTWVQYCNGKYSQINFSIFHYKFFTNLYSKVLNLLDLDLDLFIKEKQFF